MEVSVTDTWHSPKLRPIVPCFAYCIECQYLNLLNFLRYLKYHYVYALPTSVPTWTNGALRVESNSTKIAYCEPCNNDIYNGGRDLASIVLAAHNRERALVGVSPLTWNDTLAADAQVYANYLANLGKLIHCAEVPGCDPKGQGENLASGGHTTTVPIAQNMQGWIAEKNVYQGLPSATGTDVVGVVFL